MISKLLTKLGNQSHYYKHLHPSKLNTVCVVSTGRTGTKFFETFFNAIDNHTFAVHEPQPDFFDLGIEKYRAKKPSREIQQYIFQKRDPYIRNLCAQRIKRYVECNPFLSLVLPETKAVFKKAKFIIITRAPKTYVKSALNKSPLDDGAFYFYGKKDKRIRLSALDFENDAYREAWDSFSRMEKIAWYWNKCNLLLLDFMQQHPKDCLHIRFEDIFSKDSTTRLKSIKGMLDFLDIHLKDQALEQLLELGKSKKNQTQEAIYSGYEEWTTEEQQRFEELTKTANHKIYGN